MARSSRASRPAPRPAQQQSRPHSTAAAPYPGNAPSAQAPPAPPQTQAQASTGGPGMLAQMAATAGSVAVGSTIGHGLSSMLFGGSSSAAPAEHAPIQNQTQQANEMPCAQLMTAFKNCSAQAGGNDTECTWIKQDLLACLSQPTQ